MRCLPLFSILFLSIVVGCNQGPRTVEISGAVSWRGESVESGDIIFEDAAGVVGPDGLKIVNGRYVGRVKPGMKKIRLFGTKLKPVPAGVMGQGEREQIFPTEFNAESKVQIDVPDRDGNRIGFHLPKRAD